MYQKYSNFVDRFQKLIMQMRLYMWKMDPWNGNLGLVFDQFTISSHTKTQTPARLLMISPW